MVGWSRRGTELDGVNLGNGCCNLLGNKSKSVIVGRQNLVGVIISKAKGESKDRRVDIKRLKMIF